MAVYAKLDMRNIATPTCISSLYCLQALDRSTTRCISLCRDVQPAPCTNPPFNNRVWLSRRSVGAVLCCHTDMATKPQVVPLRGAEAPVKIPVADEPDMPNPRSGPTLPSSKLASPTPSPPGTPASQRTTSSAQPATPRVPSPLGRAPVSTTVSPRAEGGEESLPRVHSAPRRATDSPGAGPPTAAPNAAGPSTPLRFTRPAPPGLLIRTGFSASTGSLDSRPVRGSPLRAAVTVSDDGESDDEDDEESEDSDGSDGEDDDDDQKTAGASKSSCNPPPALHRQRGVSSKHSNESASVSHRKLRTVSSTGSAKEAKGSHATLFKTPGTMPEDHRPDGVTDRVIRYVNEMRSTAMDPARFGFLSRLHFWTLLLGWGVSLADWYAIINACWNYAWLADARAADGHPPAAGGHPPASVPDISQDPAMLVHGIALSMLFVSICKEGLKIVAFGVLLAQANEHMSSWLYAVQTEGDLSSTALPSLADLAAAEPDNLPPLPSPPPPPLSKSNDDAVPPAPTTATPPIPPAPPAAPLPPSWPTFMQVYAVLCFRAVFDLAMDRIMTGADHASRTRDEFRACLRRHAAALRYLDPAAKGGGPWALDLRGSHQVGKTIVAAMVELAQCAWVRETARAWADPARHTMWLGRWAPGLAAVAKKARGGALVALRPKDVVAIVPLVADLVFLDAVVLLFDMDDFDRFELDQYGKRTTRWQSHFRLMDQVLDNDMRSCRVIVVWCNYHKFKGRIMNRQYVATITNDLLEAYPTLPTVARQIRAAKRPRRSDGGSASRRRSEFVLPPAHRPSVIPPPTFDRDMPKPTSTLMAAVMAAGTTSPQATLPQQAPSVTSLSASSSTSDHDKVLTARILHYYFERKFAQLDRTTQPGRPAADLLTDASGTLPVVQNVLEVVRRRHFLRKLEDGTV
ncbi:hypothetical protein AMAG_18152 [Allomyces macrogynus ATCC 38327]|uniref:Uncharacterized protein n=1 Tax=Allomyces macrogynus (strain ATCC 38327) TaxID=578462 RepID=A0A0L0SAA6_ALLM3|nr:hypothetical protein AMAG_18152 [Allomyces macrogynus ATCC 38327]|eukprot:KNE59330.1 hypothetical protein AMAG_18152 [Allomyces macrogynus ATCC 38327]